jgi:hypothetical protein
VLPLVVRGYGSQGTDTALWGLISGSDRSGTGHPGDGIQPPLRSRFQPCLKPGARCHRIDTGSFDGAEEE